MCLYKILLQKIVENLKELHDGIYKEYKPNQVSLNITSNLIEYCCSYIHSNVGNMEDEYRIYLV